MEESLTQVSHNAIDVLMLGEDKPITEGLNADFFVKTAITSFAIMAPTTMNNTRQILQNEFTTRDEVLQNKKVHMYKVFRNSIYAYKCTLHLQNIHT